MVNEKKDKGLISDLYIVFKLEYVRGDPFSKTNETSESSFMSIEDIDSEEISSLSKFIVENLPESVEFSLIPYEPDERVKVELDIHDYQLYG